MEAGQPIDLQADLMRYTVDVTAGLAFGTDINTVESDEEVIQKHLDKLLPAVFKRVLSPLPHWRWVQAAPTRRSASTCGRCAARWTASSPVRGSGWPSSRRCASTRAT